MRRLSSFLGLALLMASPALADDQADCKGNNYDLVVLACTKLIDSGTLSPVDKASALGSRAWGYKGRGEYDKALADWQACEAETPGDAYCQAGLADLAFGQSNYDEAIRQADTAIAKSPRYTWPMAIKGAALRLKGLYAESIAALDQAIKLDPRYTYALYQRGLSYSNKEDYEKAISDYSKVLLIDKTYNDARSSRAYARFASGNLEKAMADINKVLEANPSDHYSWALRGYMAILQDNTDAQSAAADLEKAIALSATVDWYYTYRGLAYIKTGKLDLAKSDLDRIIAKYPKSIEDNTYLGMLMEARGDKTSAIAAYRVALAGTPTGIDGRREQKRAGDRLAALGQGTTTSQVAVTPPAPTASHLKRVALVVGNSNYQDAEITSLPNPSTDAKALAALLKSHGFDVLDYYDIDRATFLDALDQLARQAEDADTAFIFYAGHGLSIDGKDVVAPSDVRISCETTVKAERVIKLDQLFEAIALVPNQIVVLDACRNDPFPQCKSRGGRSGGGFRGLQRVAAGDTSLLIANSTAPGDVASDGPPGGHSPFADALLSKLTNEPNRLVRDIVDEVAREVRNATSGQQIPYITTVGGAPRVCLEEACGS